MISASDAVRPAMTRPPVIRRLWTMNSSTKARSAGPGQGMKPSPPKKRRAGSMRLSSSSSSRMRSISVMC